AVNLERSPVRRSRKIHGIFYTPQPVIDYMLRHTLTAKLTAADDQPDAVRILDPSAGCGAFLVSAFRLLIDWYLNRYVAQNPLKHGGDIVLADSQWKLTRRRCHEIAEQHLFGVDLDPEAVDVTRRILWLTMLESSVDTGDFHAERFDSDYLV